MPLESGSRPRDFRTRGAREERRGDEATIMMEEMMFGWDASRYSKIDLSDED